MPEETVEEQEEDLNIEPRLPEETSEEIFQASVERESTSLKLHIKVAPEIEQLLSGDKVSESSEWSDGDEPHEYYHVDGLEDEVKEWLERNYPTSDQYGHDYIEGDNVNKSILRTVGISEGDGVTFHIDESHPESTLVKTHKDLRDTVIDIYKTFLRPLCVEANVNVKQEI